MIGVGRWDATVLCILSLCCYLLLALLSPPQPPLVDNSVTMQGRTSTVVVMTLSTFNAIAAEFNSICTWDQRFHFKVNQAIVDLSPAIGPSAFPLLGAPCQPTEYPPNVSFLFDPSKYKGIDSYWALTGDIPDSLPEAFMRRCGRSSNDSPRVTSFFISCSFCEVSDSASSRKFEMSHFQKKERKLKR